MTNKKLEAKRLIIFLLLAFGISWVPAIIMNCVVGYHEWFETYKMPFFALIVGFGPALANVITRKLTHEGWHDSMLHLKLKGNIKYYLIAVFSVVALGIAEGILATIIYGNCDFSDVGKGMNAMQIIGNEALTISLIPLMAFNTFGEEFGWRGYMNQKMEPLLGTTGTVIVGGILWGLWHAELTVVGHNFGTEYDGYPYLGILAMCILCTFMGMGLMWVTKKTGSIYPAAIMHAANNFGGKSIGRLLISGIPEDRPMDIFAELIVSIPSFLLGLVFLILMLRDKKNEKKM
ncbi:MAG: CPBP family intramembrane glutamic endopeptidase [Oscillospiraceae bacterium]